MFPIKNHFLSRQKGAFLVIFAVSFLVLLALCGIFIDVGLIYNAKAELKAATDSAALAGALNLNQPAQINAAVQEYLTINRVQNTTAEEPVVTLGRWDDKSQSFDARNTSKPTAVQVTAGFTGTYYFSKIFNLNEYTLTSTSIASVIDDRPLNIFVIADISANMSWASQLQGVGMGDVTQSSVIKNITRIYNQFNDQGLFNSPNYGSLNWDKFLPGASVSAVLNQFKLNGVAYPYDGFTWIDYIKYVQNLTQDNSAYRDHFGFLTLINFWQEQAYATSQTPILKKAAEQPLQSVKNAVTYFSKKLNSSYDTLGLTVISHGTGFVTGLTSDYNDVTSHLINYQAGEYGSPDGTIIPAINAAIEGFSAITRANPKKIILILTNGKTSWAENNSNSLDDISDSISALKHNRIYAYSVVIGPDSYPELNAALTKQTGGKTYLVSLGNTNYTQQIDAIYNEFKVGPPRLVQ